MTRRAAATLVVLLTVGALPCGAQSPGRMVVHEWGTITTRHERDGTPQGRLNRIDEAEVLPSFVHRFEPSETVQKPGQALMKSPATPGRPDVTMRLETPVIYFYPPAGSHALPPFSVDVHFRGGVLNEFYPEATASVAVDVDRVNMKMQAGLVRSWDGNVLNNYVVGALRWGNVSLKKGASVPKTASHVWLAPRAVHATSVAMPSGEGERYLFYRGVAHLDALFQTRVTSQGVALRAPQHLLWLRANSFTIPQLWFVDVGADGRAAFRTQTSVLINKDGEGRPLAEFPLFAESDRTTAKLADLKKSMKQALISAGLYTDEADAMLATWGESYFRTPGLRIFYVVPSEWTSYFLPLAISAPHDLTRVLIGRIDLLSATAAR